MARIDLGEVIRNRDPEKIKEILECKEQGHPYPEKILVPYSPRTGTALVTCTNCGMPYNRIGNQEERDRYTKMRNLVITI